MSGTQTSYRTLDPMRVRRIGACKDNASVSWYEKDEMYQNVDQFSDDKNVDPLLGAREDCGIRSRPERMAIKADVASTHARIKADSVGIVD